MFLPLYRQPGATIVRGAGARAGTAKAGAGKPVGDIMASLSSRREGGVWGRRRGVCSVKRPGCGNAAWRAAGGFDTARRREPDAWREDSGLHSATFDNVNMTLLEHLVLAPAAAGQRQHDGSRGRQPCHSLAQRYHTPRYTTPYHCVATLAAIITTMVLRLPAVQHCS